MVRIISDTSTMYSTQQAREAGFSVSPLSVSIADESYRELDEMTWDRFVELIRQGNMPTSSQPLFEQRGVLQHHYDARQKHGDEQYAHQQPAGDRRGDGAV